MKYAIIIPDGAADLPLAEWGDRTPLAAANMPNIDWIARHGKCGTVRNIPKGMESGSDVALLSVFGYDPRECYTGRAPLEAAAQDITVGDNQWVLRCNLVTIIDDIMEDHSAGHISTEEAATMMTDLAAELGNDHVQFHTGVSYRHLLVYTGNLKSLKTTPPHNILGQTADDSLPRGKGGQAMVKLIKLSRPILAAHEINAVRSDLGENPATSIWLWGQGQMPHLQSFEHRYGVRGAAITAVDLVRGVAGLIGWDRIDVPGATGYIDTDYAGKGTAAVEALSDHDLVVVHVEAPDEAGHAGQPETKVHALEQIDANIVAPVLEHLRGLDEPWRILVLPDHPTPCHLRTHTSDPVPFTLAGEGIATVLTESFTEESAAASDLHIPRGSDLMEFFLTVR